MIHPTSHNEDAPAFEGIDNFRDFGGYPTADGRRVKRGRLFRSAHHGRATDADLNLLSALDLAAVVDLRRSEERQRDPSQRPPAFTAEVIDNDIDQHSEDSYHAFLKTSDLSVESMKDYLVSYYAAAPFEPRHIDLYSRYFRALATAEGPVLIHCAAGKDRTGILAALTHQLMGVAYEDSVADYLLTNDPERIERRLKLFGDYVEAISGRRASEEALRVTMGVDALYLDTAFEAIKGRYGSIDAYLEQALGVDADLKAEIHQRLLHEH
jgi:protein tyrosine/serine phosphatase